MNTDATPLLFSDVDNVSPHLTVVYNILSARNQTIGKCIFAFHDC